MPDQSLEEVYQSSKLLMQDIISQHEDARDFLYAMRFLLRQGDMGNNLFIDGIDRLMRYQETLKTVAMSYHQAVRNATTKDESAEVV